MTTSRRLLVAVSLLALGTATPAGAGGPAPYPVNACVGTKQSAAGAYCRAVLRAWRSWETNQDTSARTAAVIKAAEKLDAKWLSAESRSLSRGSDCADTTIDDAGLRAGIDSAVSAIVGEVNAGLNLGIPGEAACGGALLKTAASKCRSVLAAESRHIFNLSLDPQGTTLATATYRAQVKFATKFEKTLAHGCPSQATAAQVEATIDGLVADVVRDTTISPNVDDTQFTQYPLSGPIEYLGKTLNPQCVHSTPYSFFAKRGTVNKLVVYYQGGGACWEQVTCGAPTCDTSVGPSDNPNLATTGFANLSNPANPFRDWNVVFVPYCSCDIHFGDAAQDYNNANPSSPLHIEHRGFENSRAVEKWAREHFLDPDQIFVTGSSAGAYGAWFHAPLLHETWPASHFQVLADAGNGVVTQNFIDTFFPNWNFIGNIPPEFPEIAQIIQSGGGIPQYTEFVANHFPATRWAHYASAYDGGSGGQTGFYNLMLNNNNLAGAVLWWEGSCAFNDVMLQQATDTYANIHGTTDNYRYYVGTGSRHTMWGSNKVYNDTTGGVPLLVDWVSAMLGGTPAWTNVVANDFGLLLSGDPRPSPLTAPFFQVGSDVKVICSASGAFLD